MGGMRQDVRQHRLGRETVHYAWDRDLPPLLEIESGDTVTVETRDAADGYFSRHSTPQDVLARVRKGHALTGPIALTGARPGDVLQVEILELQTGDWGWTMIAPGRGLLPEDFPDPYLKSWDLSDGETARFNRDIGVPIEPFCGVMGVAWDEPGQQTTMPPRRWGGNLDVKQLTTGATLWLPIALDGARFSLGDAHAAQGDGEVCISAIETAATATLRLSVRRDFSLDSPELRTAGPLTPKTNTAGWHATTGIAPDLMDATRAAVRAMIGYLGREHGLSREEAYVLSSVAVDLKISEVVDVVRPVERRGRPQNQRGRRRPELGRQRLLSTQHLPPHWLAPRSS